MKEEINRVFRAVGPASLVLLGEINWCRTAEPISTLSSHCELLFRFIVNILNPPAALMSQLSLLATASGAVHVVLVEEEENAHFDAVLGTILFASVWLGSCNCRRINDSQ